MSESKTFETPEPIAVTLAMNVADVRISAGERTDTVVTVTANDASKKADVEAAEQTRIEFSGGRLLVKAPRSWKHYTIFKFGRESVDVSIELPAGSSVEGEVWVGDLSCIGRLGGCRYTTGAGDIRLERAGPVQVSTGAGRVGVDVAERKSEITGSGQMRIGELRGPAVVKNLSFSLLCSGADGVRFRRRAGCVHGARRGHRGRSPSSETCKCNAFDEVALGHAEDQQRGQECHRRGGHQQVPLCAVLAVEQG